MSAPLLETPGRRAVPEWIGATPDSPIPRIVKGRIWSREGGRCYLTGKKIMPGDAFDYEHVKSIRNGGENRETNIRLALRDKHREKTAEEASEGAKADRIHAKHHGYFPKSKTPLKGRGFEPSRPRTQGAQRP
jgi:5-methylcytosine-specific restriction protein A